jgi:hypothetical protein
MFPHLLQPVADVFIKVEPRAGLAAAEDVEEVEASSRSNVIVEICSAPLWLRN